MSREIKAIMVLLLALALVVACSQQSGTEEQAAAQQEEQAQPASEQQAAMPTADQLAQERQPEQAAVPTDEIQGTVVKTEEGIVIFSDQGSFMVAGQDLDGLVGKNVKVTGTIEESDGKSVLNISSVSVIE